MPGRRDQSSDNPGKTGMVGRYDRLTISEDEVPNNTMTVMHKASESDDLLPYNLFASPDTVSLLNVSTRFYLGVLAVRNIATTVYGSLPETQRRYDSVTS